MLQRGQINTTPHSFPINSTRRKRQRTRRHLNISDHARIQLEASFRSLVHKHAGKKRIERHLRQRVETVKQNGAENVAVLQNRRVTRVLVVLQKKLLVGVVSFERILAENAAEFALGSVIRENNTFISFSHLLAVSISSGESVSADQKRKKKKATIYTEAIREKGIEKGTCR